MQDKLLKTQIKYHEEREKKNEIISELNRTTEDLRDVLKFEHHYKEEPDKYKNFIKSGFIVDEDGTLWVLIEEYHYANEELAEYPEVKTKVLMLRSLYDEKEQGMFYERLTRCDIRNMVRAGNDYIPE